MTKLLSEAQLQNELKNLQEWEGDTNNGVIQKDYIFRTFSDAIIFVNRVAEIAEEEEHHPEVCISYNNVTILLSTHDSGGVTSKDIHVAKRIEEIGK